MPLTRLLTTVLMAHTIPRFIHHPHSPLSVLLPPPTTTPSLFSNHHHHHKATVLIHCPLFCLTHTHTWCGWHVPLWLLSRPVCGVCGWHAHPITSSSHTATTTVALPIATPPLFGVCVCGWKHVPHGHAQPPTTHLHGVVFSLSSQVRAIKPFAIHPVCVCGGLVVGLCWCGHLCECLCVGWLCCFPPHCVSCVPPCPHPSVSPHSLALVLLLLVVVLVIGG